MQRCSRRRNPRRAFGRRQRAVIACKPLGRGGDLRAGRRVLSCNCAVPYGRRTEDRDQPGDCNEALDSRLRRFTVGAFICTEIATAALASQPELTARLCASTTVDGVISQRAAPVPG